MARSNNRGRSRAHAKDGQNCLVGRRLLTRWLRQSGQGTEYYGGWGWYGPGTVETTNYVEGSLVIDIADRVQKRLVWHGYGTENIFSQGGEEQMLFEAVDAVLAKYPPVEAGAGN